MAESAAAPGLQFKLGSIPVLIRWTFFILSVLGFVGQPIERGIAWTLLVLVSVLLHELGHALVMKAFGYAPRIELHALGGWTIWPTGARPGPGQRFLVSLAGPGIQIVFATLILVGWIVARPPEEWRWFLFDALFVNFGWAAFNLLPVLPWDGGSALESAVTWKFGPKPKVVGAVSMIFGVAIIALALWSRQILVGYFGFMGVQQGWTRWNYKEPTLDELVAAASKNVLPLQFFAPLIKALMDKGRPDVVRDLFGRRIVAGKAITPEDEKIAQAIVTTLFEQQHYAETADLCGRFFEETGHAVQAVNAASAYSRLGDLDRAMAWLEKAVAAGYTDRASLAADEDLAPLRERPDFQALLAIKS